METCLLSTTSFPLPDLNLWSKIGVLSACCWGVVLMGFVIQFCLNMLLVTSEQRRIGYFHATCLGLSSVIPVCGLLVVIQAFSGNVKKDAWGLPALLVPPFTEWRIDQAKSHAAAEQFRLEVEKERFRHLNELRSELLRYALSHGGRYPELSTMDEIASSYWHLPPSIGGKYEYHEGLSYKASDDILASEPDLGTGERWIMTVAGVITKEISSTTEESDIEQ